MKKALVVTAAAAVLGLAGCGEDGPGDANKPASAPKPHATQPASAPKPDATQPAGGSNPQAEEAAVAAAEAWLTTIDGGRYAESWDQAAEYVRNAVPKDRWVQQLTAVRGPLGKPVSRQVASKRYRTSLPGAPDGQYVVIQFTSSFENKKSAVETVTPMREKDGTWRVSGYYIK